MKNKCDDYLFSGVKIHKFTLTADYRHTRLITPMICYSPFVPACIIRDSIVVSIPAGLVTENFLHFTYSDICDKAYVI